MGKLFDLENPFWSFMGKLTDMMILTVVWFVCCLPVVTAGAATTAFYYVMMKLSVNREGYILKDFFKSFKSNFRQSTIVGLILLALGIFLAVDISWYSQFKSGVGVMVFWMFCLMTVLCLMVAVYVFPILARCEVTVKRLFLMAFMISIKNFGWTLLMLTITGCLVAVGLFVSAPILLLAPGIGVYLHSKILHIIFKQYHLEAAL